MRHSGRDERRGAGATLLSQFLRLTGAEDVLRSGGTIRLTAGLLLWLWFLVRLLLLLLLLSLLLLWRTIRLLRLLRGAVLLIDLVRADDILRARCAVALTSRRGYRLLGLG